MIKILRDGKALGDVHIVRRTIEQARIGRERGGLREPGGIPIAGDFAPRLITRTGTAVETVK